MKAYPGIVEGNIPVIPHLLMREMAGTIRGIINEANASVTIYGYLSNLSNFLLGERTR